MGQFSSVPRESANYGLTLSILCPWDSAVPLVTVKAVTQRQE